jgi:hypothetical protein
MGCGTATSTTIWVSSVALFGLRVGYIDMFAVIALLMGAI